MELIEPPADFSPSQLEKGNEKTHKIADSYRAKEPDPAGKSSISSDQSRQTSITIDHVSLDQRPPYGRPPMPPTEVEVFQPYPKPAAFPSNRPGPYLPGRPVPYPPSRPGLHPPFRPGSFPPNRPSLYPPHVPLPPDVEVFNPPGSQSPNIPPPPPDVEVFNPSDVNPISFPSNVADIEVVPFYKNTVSSLLRMNDTSVESNLHLTEKTPEESQGSYTSSLKWNITKVFADYERLMKFLDREESAADTNPSPSNTSSVSKNISSIVTTEPPAKQYIASKMNHDFVVKVYHNLSKICFNKIRGDDYAEPEKCITFPKNAISEATDGQSPDEVENVNSDKMADESAQPVLTQVEYEIPKSTIEEKETTNEVYSSNEDVFQSTTQIPKDTKYREAENSLVDDNDEVKKLIGRLVVAELHSVGTATDKTKKPNSTELPAAQEITPEKIVLTEEIIEVKNISSEEQSAESKNVTESNKKQQNSTPDQISAVVDEKILNDPLAKPTIDQILSPKELQALTKILAEYIINRMQISSVSSNSVSSSEDTNEYIITPVLPFSYAEPSASGRSADDNEELASIFDSAGFVLPEDNLNSFKNYRSVPLTDAVNDASELFLVSQQPENMKSAESYLNPSGEIIVPYEFESYV